MVTERPAEWALLLLRLYRLARTTNANTLTQIPALARFCFVIDYFEGVTL